MSNSSSVNGETGATTVDGSNNNTTNGAAMNLFPLNGPPVTLDFDSNSVMGRTIDLFPQGSGFDSCDSQSGQMTIFYGGQVLVFNDLPNDKAKEIMDIASSNESTHKKRKLDQPTDLGPNQTMNVGSGFGLDVNPTTLPPSGSVTSMSDLPIARKASLHRFLQKRKDRLVGKSSVNVDVSTPTKGVDGNAWLGLGATRPVIQVQQQI